MIQRATTAAMTTGLMLSGGLDSTALLVKLLRSGQRVQPFYVSTGCRWESAERAAIDRLLDEIGSADVCPAVDLCPVVDLAMPVDDLFSSHWSMTGLEVPDDTTTDDAVFLPGRNPLLLLKPALWCGKHQIETLAIATLSNNPFADASPHFFESFEAVIKTATSKNIEIVRPFAEQSKAEILELLADLPHQLTISCLSPQNDQHCGRCNKCAERARALQLIPGGDSTPYASTTSAILD